VNEQGSALADYLKRRAALKLLAKVGKAKLLLVGAAAIAAFLASLALLAVIVGATSEAKGGEGGMSCTVGGGRDGPPSEFLPIYAAAAGSFDLGPRGPGILAAIHKVESTYGRSTLPGVRSGSNSAGAQGPMQFLESSWEAFGVDGDGDGVKDVYEATDAIFGAANLLHAEGAPRDWYGAIFAYNHADWYVRDVEESAARFSGSIVCTATAAVPTGGDALLQGLETLYRPRSYTALPSELWIGGGPPQAVDSRLWTNAVWLLQTFHLRVTAARESGHETHGDGTALDMVPAPGWGWDETARAAAEALGWRERCGASGTAPVCSLAPAIQLVAYNGFRLHGDPAHAGANAHLHVSWQSSSFGCGALCRPAAWVRVFPLGG
jgi:hypothetical protein